MAKKNITIDDLAVMVQKGFTDTATKVEFNSLKKTMDDGFRAMNARLDKLQNDRIEKLEKRMEKLEEALATK
ncbi:MAG: hypothetical protein AAB509_02805 [Patescibacteria group bacterium]